MKGSNWKRFKCTSNMSWNWKLIWKVKDTMKARYRVNTWIANPSGYTVSSGIVGFGIDSIFQNIDLSLG